MSSSASASTTATQLIHNNAIMIFSKTYCPHCKRSKDILTAKQREYSAERSTPFSLQILELDDDIETQLATLGKERPSPAPTGAAIQDYLAKLTGARTVPRIFVAEEVLGGRSDLEEAMAGEAGGKGLDGYWLKKAVEYTKAAAAA